VSRASASSRWLPAVLGLLLTVLGSGYLFVTFLLPRLVVARERAAGLELFDPRTGQDLLLAAPINWGRVAIAVASTVAGVVLVRAGVRGRD
jgi:hypothetical protein